MNEQERSNVSVELHERNIVHTWLRNPHTNRWSVCIVATMQIFETAFQLREYLRTL